MIPEVHLRVAIAEEDMASVTQKLDTIKEKLKEAKALADEVASFLENMPVSINVETEDDSADVAD